MEYDVKRSITGKWHVHYECPNCNESLVNDLAEAGQPDTCPNCASEFVVPGTTEKQQIEREERESLRQRKLTAAKKQLQRDEDEATRALERALAEVEEVDAQRIATKRERVRLTSEVLARSYGLIDKAVHALEAALAALIVLCLLGAASALALTLVGLVSGLKSGYSLGSFTLPILLFAFSLVGLVLLGSVAAILRIEKSTRATAMAVVEIADLLTVGQEENS